MSSSFEGVYERGIIDPGTPRPNPTRSFWQSEPHALANYRSVWPKDIVDVAIIGAGVTGTNLARNLLTKQPNLRVAVVEARSLCSGATGRNGGHIKTMSYAVWEDRKQRYGVKEAIRLTEFEESHLASMTSAAQDNGLDCDIVHTTGLDAYFDQKTFDKALAALADMKAHAPHLAKRYTVHKDRGELQSAMKLSKRCVGAICVPAASIWPYKLVTGLMAGLIEAGKVNVQTNTTVTSIDDDPGCDFAVIKTNRGEIRARNIVHATNGWLGHLLPELRPFISPVRGNVLHYSSTSKSSHEKYGTSALGFDSKFSYWLRYAEKDYDYLIQRARGDIVVGRANTGRRATGDDTETDLVPVAHLRGFGPEVAASTASPAPGGIDHVWSGILGFTQDAAPFVGRLPFSGRSHQWVCGAYHGIGMIKAFRSAEMLSYMILGEEVPAEYPRSMLTSEERFRTLQSTLDDTQIVPKSKL